MSILHFFQPGLSDFTQYRHDVYEAYRFRILMESDTEEQGG